MRPDSSARQTGMNFSATNARLGTARGGTALKAGPGGGLRPDVVVSSTQSVLARPGTNAGVGGVPSTAMGGGQGTRLIQDKKYFMVQLKNKNLELDQETKKFKTQIETITKDNNAYVVLEKKCDALTKEVRQLEGTLADYNLAVDKQRAGTRPEDIANMYEHVKTQNDKFKAQLDDLFIERKGQEDQIQQIEAQLHEIHQAAEIKLNELDPDQRSEYESLIQENRVLIQNINAQRNRLEDINMTLGQAESKLRLDHNKQKYVQLKETLVELERKKADLEVQTNENNLSFPEARDRLLAKVKEDNSVIQNTEKRVRDVRKMIENYDKMLKEMSSENDDNKQSEQDKQKYEILYQRDKEMSEFIDNFEPTRTHEINQMHEIENRITQNLEETSRYLSQQTDLPTVDDFVKMQKEHDVKGVQLDQAQDTLVRVQSEYEQRLAELRNLDTLEENIARQLSALREKMKNMQGEVDTKFNNINNIRGEKERRRTKLLKDREDLQNNRQKVKDELNTVSYDYELKKQKMSLHEQYSALSELEKKISQNEGTLYNMNSFIQTKRVDMDYGAHKEACEVLISQLNGILARSVKG